MQKEQQSQCILCYEEANIIGLLPCNHRLICHSCVMKLMDSGFYICPICKAASKTVLFTDKVNEDFEQILKGPILRSESNAAFMYTNRDVKKAVERESQFICSYSSCGNEFSSLNALKRHLNETHRRQFCDLCLQNRRCLLSEQVLYSDPELSSHLADGEIEDTGIVSLYHPFCEFCRERYYDEDTFLKHLKSHEQCHLCNKKPQLKYIYYKDIKALENHFDASHFMCKHNSCLDRKLLNVYATEDLRDFHYAQAHLGQNFSKKARRNIECIELTGFNQTEDHQERPKDGFGKNFVGQLMSVSRKVELVDQNHTDGSLDIRELLTDRCSVTRHMGIAQIVNRVGELQYRLEGQALYLDNIDLFRPLTMKSMPKALLCQLIDDLYVYQRGGQLKRLFFDGLTDIKTYQEYCQSLEMAVAYGSPLLFFYVFPQLIRFFKDTNDRKAFMDNYYLRRILELPSRVPTLITECKTYSQFTRSFRSAIEEVITRRIQTKKIDLSVYLQLLNAKGDYRHKDSFFVPRDKIKHLYHMVQKVRTRELLRLNWLLKVGMPLRTHEYLLKTVYMSPPDQLPELLAEITNNELALLYCYFRIIEQAFEGKTKFNFEKSKEDANLLRDIILKNKDRYGKALPQYEDIQKHQHEKVQKTVQRVIRVVNEQVDLPELPKLGPTPEYAEPKFEVGFGNLRQNFKKWDEQSRKKPPQPVKTQENEARNKVFDHIANKNKKKGKESVPTKPTSNKPSTPAEPVVSPAAQQTLTDAEQLRLAIEESKKSFESERRRRQQIQQQEQQSRRKELDKQRKQLAETKEEDRRDQRKDEDRNKIKKDNKQTKGAQTQKNNDKKQQQQESKALPQKLPQKQPPKSANKSVNIFDQLEHEEQELKMKRAKLKSEKELKTTEKVTMKALSKENPTIHSSPALNQDAYPILSSHKKEKPADKRENLKVVLEDEFPELGAKQPASWIDQVSAKTKDPTPQEVKVRKKKGRTTIEQTVDIFGRN